MTIGRGANLTCFAAKTIYIYIYTYILFSAACTRSVCLAGDRAAASRNNLLQMTSTGQLLLLSLKQKKADKIAEAQKEHQDTCTVIGKAMWLQKPLH